MTSRSRRHGLVAVLLVGVVLAGCGGGDSGGDSGGDGGDRDGGPTSSPAEPSSASTAPTPSEAPEPADDSLDLALSEPVEDSVYPDVGDPGVDALHYDLDLTWDPTTDTLTGVETLTFRSTEDDDGFQLDLGEPLEVDSVTVDGAEADFDHDGKDLLVAHPVVADERYELVVSYAGTPEPVAAPTTRADFATVGFTIDEEHQTWTMQEPFGAYSWYAVNDQPSDKALYDFTLHVPAPWTGVANGEQVGDEEADGVHTTSYHLAEPAASYLVTLAFGDYDETEDTGPGGVPITYWTFRGDGVDRGLRSTPAAMAWLEERLGPYPFDTAGIVLVDSESGMETQTMITLGTTSYSTSPAVVLHELAHHWWGDQVTPSDWRDVWMNEGMATYLQLLWEAEDQGVPEADYLEGYVQAEADYRAESGPPGAYDPEEFATSNVYYSGAFLWHDLRRLVGDDVFWRAVRSWPASQDNRSSDRETLLAHLEQQTGEELDDFYDAWLLGETTPPPAG